MSFVIIIFITIIFNKGIISINTVDYTLINSYEGDSMTISVKMLNDSIKKVSETNSLLDMLLEFEKVLDKVDLYAFKNWEQGEVLYGPKLSRHFLEVVLMYPYKKMPDPSGAKRLMARDILVDYKKDTLISPRQIKSFDDVVVEARPDGTQRYKAKTDSEPVWLVKVKMPRRYVDEFDMNNVEVDEESYVDMDDINSSADMQVNDATEVAVPTPNIDPATGAAL